MSIMATVFQKYYNNNDFKIDVKKKHKVKTSKRTNKQTITKKLTPYKYFGVKSPENSYRSKTDV